MKRVGFALLLTLVASTVMVGCNMGNVSDNAQISKSKALENFAKAHSKDADKIER